MRRDIDSSRNEFKVVLKRSSVLRKEILEFLISLRRDDPGKLPSLSDISEALGADIDLLDDQLRILSVQGAIRANRTIDGGAAPLLLDAGYLLYEKISAKIESRRDDDPKEDFLFKHSDDYRIVVWADEIFTFNKTQALCIRALHSSFTNGFLWVSSEQISKLLLENEIVDSRMSFIFRNHKSWKSLVVKNPSQKGLYKLNLPS